MMRGTIGFDRWVILAEDIDLSGIIGKEVHIDPMVIGHIIEAKTINNKQIEILIEKCIPYRWDDKYENRTIEICKRVT